MTAKILREFRMCLILLCESAHSLRTRASPVQLVKRRVDDAYSEYVAGLAEHIEAGLDHALARFKKARKAKKAA